jgi:superfamily I DNA and/or RNA helicase
MSSVPTIRLNKVLRELNLSLDKAISFLDGQGIEIEARHTTKIDDSVYNLLLGEFSKPKNSIINEPKSIIQIASPSINHDALVLNKNIRIPDFDFDEQEELEEENETEYERNKRVWHKYITAQEKIIDYRSLPVAINPNQKYTLEGNTLKIEVDQDIFKKIFKDEVETIFKIDTYDFDSDHILQDLEITEQINIEDLKNLKESASSKYIEFNEHPIIEGVIRERNSKSKGLEKIIGKISRNYLFNKEGLILLTQAEKEKVDVLKNVSFKKNAGAVFPLFPNIKFLLSLIYKDNSIQETGNRFTIFNGKIHNNIEAYLEKEIGLKRKRFLLIFQFPKNSGLEKKIKDLEKFKGIDLPTPENDAISFRIEVNSSNLNDTEIRNSISLEEQLSHFKIEYRRIDQIIRKYFPEKSYQTNWNVKYSYDGKQLRKFYSKNSDIELKFWDRIYPDIHGDEFQISSDKSTLSFDFQNFEDLESKKQSLRAYNYFCLEDYGTDHKFKFNIKFETGLHDLQKKLKINAESLSTRLMLNGQELRFYKHYKPGNKGFVRDYLTNVIREYIEDEKYDVYIDDTFKEKYLCVENFELKVEQEEEKLSKLKRESFYYGDKKNKKPLGRLQKVDYPSLEFFVEDENLEDLNKSLLKQEIKAVFPDLKGERDKILRLTDTVNKLESEVTLPNNNSRNFLFDSSMAKPIHDVDSLLDEQGNQWRLFEEQMLSQHLNTSQKQAILKSLHAQDLMLIQGPPGTGKSTAIAEIIWHHILENPKQKILLTSETNLAVDNAMDRIKTDSNNIVKPIRFGNEDRLASEGLFYSYETVVSFGSDLSFKEPNIVEHWVENVAKRVGNDENINLNNALNDWRSYLNGKDKEVRSIFTQQYLENVNLIGATGSSMGKLNSEGRYTSFFHSYLKVFNKGDYFPKIDYKKCNGIDIVFDTIIMDEASKATPPELALPIIYGKKAIIVGDHRQLPPMVDGEEIKDTLYSIGEKELASTLERDEFKKSQFENLFQNPNLDLSLKGTFNTQYRMHPAINDAVYQFYIDDGGLHCGLPLDEKDHQSFLEPSSRYHGLNYKDILTPETHTMWIDVNDPEIKEGTSRSNIGEVEAIDSILYCIKNSDGFSEYTKWLSTQPKEESEIGIISFYGKQINHLNKMIEKNHKDISTRLSTVDKFQGMERNIIIVSMVRSDKIAATTDQSPDFSLYESKGYPEQQSLGFAESPNRLNVGLSRARRLLIIVGNKDHFCKKEIYQNVFNTISDSANGKIISSNILKKTITTDEQ